MTGFGSMKINIILGQANLGAGQPISKTGCPWVAKESELMLYPNIISYYNIMLYPITF